MVKGPKDPNAPRRPPSAFMAWRGINYNRICKMMPVGHSFGEMAKKLSDEWKLVNETEKAKFVEDFKTKMATYNKLMKAYKLTANYKSFQTVKAAAKVDNIKKTKFRKDENAPKKPLSAYFMYLADNRDAVKRDNPALINKQIVTKMGEMWSALSAADKKAYEEKNAAAKKKYAAELEKYKKSADFEKYEAEKFEFYSTKQSKLKKAKKRSNPDADEAPAAKKVKMVKKSKKSKKKKKKKSKSPKSAKSPKSSKSPKSKSKSKKPKAPKAKSAKKASKGKKVKASKKPRKASKAKKKAM